MADCGVCGSCPPTDACVGHACAIRASCWVPFETLTGTECPPAPLSLLCLLSQPDCVHSDSVRPGHCQLDPGLCAACISHGHSSAALPGGIKALQVGVCGGGGTGRDTASGVCGSSSGVCHRCQLAVEGLTLLTVCVAAALCAPACCCPYRHVAPTESPMARVVKVVAAALHNRCVRGLCMCV